MTENNKVYELKFDKKFTRKYKNLGRSLQIEGDKKIQRLKRNPKDQGKPLKFFHNLYEFHLQMYRIFYIIHEQKVNVLFIGLEHKDETDKYLRSLTKDKINSLMNENL